MFQMNSLSAPLNVARMAVVKALPPLLCAPE
jgi:hypothetical protein